MVKTEELLNIKSSKDLSYLVSLCKRCGLYRTKHCDVVGEGNLKAKILFIGEAPGKNEDLGGKPFLGRAGKILDYLFLKANIDRKKIFITNLVKHRPPKNRKPSKKEIEACTPYLQKQIELINPRLIVLLGSFALNSIFPDKVISKTHGQFLNKGKLDYLSLYHPAAAIYNQKLKNILVKDFKKIKEFKK